MDEWRYEVSTNWNRKMLHEQTTGWVKCYVPKECEFHLDFFPLVTEDLLISLHTLFPQHSVSALDLIDHKSISLITSPSGRKCYSCVGSSGTTYVLSYTGFVCNCPAFRYNLNNLVNKESMWCKHLLALQLTIAMDIVQQKEVNFDFNF